MVGIIICALAGIVFFTIGIAMLSNRKKKETNCTSKTNGKVINIVKTYAMGDEHDEWSPVIEYTIGEQKIIKTSPYGGSKTKYRIGQDLEIFYNPENYNDYYIAGEDTQKILGVIFSCVGIVVLIMTIFYAILMR